MKRLINRAAVIAVALCTFGAAAAEISGNVTYTTDYRFRGITQTDRGQAIQGGFDYEAENGFYAGTWASNVAFEAWVEVDYYLGFTGEVGDGIGYDLGYIYYDYPEDGDLEQDYSEIYGSLSFSDFTVGLAFSNDYFAESDQFIYVYGDYSMALTDAVSLSAHIGWNSFDDADAFFVSPDGDDYFDYSVSLSTEAYGVEWSAAIIGTDLDGDSECFGNEKLCEANIVLSVSKSL